MPAAQLSFRHALGVGVFIALVGPLAGSMAMLTVMFFANGWGGGASGVGDAAATFLRSVPAFAMLGYMIGGLPALIAAIWLGRRTRTVCGFCYGEAALAGGAGAVVGTMLLSLGTGNWRSIFSVPLAILLPSLLAAVVCRYFLVRLG